MPRAVELMLWPFSGKQAKKGLPGTESDDRHCPYLEQGQGTLWHPTTDQNIGIRRKHGSANPELAIDELPAGQWRVCWSALTEPSHTRQLVGNDKVQAGHVMASIGRRAMPMCRQASQG